MDDAKGIGLAALAALLVGGAITGFSLLGRDKPTEPMKSPTAEEVLETLAKQSPTSDVECVKKVATATEKYFDGDREVDHVWVCNGTITPQLTAYLDENGRTDNVRIPVVPVAKP